MQGTLNCRTICELDGGRAEGIINNAIAIAMDDIANRERELKPRKVEIVIHFVPNNGDVAFDLEVVPKVPAQRTGLTIGKIRHKKGRSGLPETQVVFSFESPDNPDQGSLGDFIPPTKPDGEIDD